MENVADASPKGKSHGAKIGDYELPIDSLSRSLLSVPLELRGFYFGALTAMLEFGEPLPPNERASMLRVGVTDVRMYRRLLAACFDCGLLYRTESGSVSSDVPAQCRAIKTPKRKSIPTYLRDAVLRKTNGVCTYCAVFLDTTQPGMAASYEVDHVLPVILGGGDDIANLVPACRSCNSLKRAQTALQFIGGANVL